MKIFTILLLVISGLIISDINTIFIGISLLFLAIIIIFKKYRHDRKFLITGIALFTLFLIIGFIELQSFQDSSNFSGIVIKRSDVILSFLMESSEFMLNLTIQILVFLIL